MSKVLVISGASKGIGLATAKLFLERDYRVINLSRSACELEGVTNLTTDMSDVDWDKQVSEQLLSSVRDADQISIVHNAALMTKDNVKNISAETMQRVLQLNVVAAAQLNGLLLPAMNQGSSIIYISSTLGRKAVANTHAYVVSKHAVVGQMRATCQDLAGTMIHTAAVCPGFTETEMLKEHLGNNPELHEQITSMIAHKRLVQPSEIAETVWFCAQNPVINGALIDANLGQIEN